MELLVDPSVRLKVTNDCQWTCEFCHNEGTELPNEVTKRVSVFLDPSTMRLPMVRNFDADLGILDQVAKLKGVGVKEVHLTGGEPTLNPSLPNIVSYFFDRGFGLKMTTNGQARVGLMEDLISRGLSAVTFSVLSLTPEEFLGTQRIQSLPWAKAMIERSKENMLVAKKAGAVVKINTVVIDKDDYGRVDLIREFADANNIELSLLNSLGDGEEAVSAVFNYLEDQGGIAGNERGSVNSSTFKRFYTLPSGQVVIGKGIRSLHPDVVCEGCDLRDTDNCVEKFYGVRLELRDKVYTRLCVQKTNPKTVMTLDDFIQKGVYYTLTEKVG